MKLPPLDLTAAPVRNYGADTFYVRGVTPRPDGTFFAWESWRPVAPAIGLETPLYSSDKDLRVDVREFYDLTRETFADAEGERLLTDEEFHFFRDHFPER